MDIGLGDMDGYEVTVELRKFLSQEETRIIAISAM